MLDVFNSNAFSVVSLTDAVNKIPFVPGRLGQIGLFNESGVTTTTVAIEQKEGELILVPPTPRGGPGTVIDKNKRSLLDIRIPHFEINDAVMAEEVQGIRAFGEENIVETVMGKVAQRGQTHSQSHSATEEYARVGAVKGVITYADASTLSLFTTFGVSQEAEIDFDLHTDGSATGAFRKKCATTIRLIGTQLGGVPWRGVHALCGDAFYDMLIGNKEVRDTYLNWNAAIELRAGYATPNQQSWGAFEFGGITWENYRGAVGNTSFVHTDKCHLFPLGAPGLFRTYYAPADYVETVNTMGRRLYQKQYEMPNGKGIHLDTQMNALHICTRPKTLLVGRHT